MIPITSQASLGQATTLNPLDEVVREKQMQLSLNQGVKVTEAELAQLRSNGYSISYDPNTIEKFRNFVFPNDPELTHAIQTASAKTGLLIDRFKMYRPGPASAKDCLGAAKGYHEIFALFEERTTEKRAIAKDVSNFLALFEGKAKTILDMACGNGMQIQELLILYPCSVIGLDNLQGCVEQCRKLLPKQSFQTHDAFAEAPEDLKKKADILFVSHFYCSPEKAPVLIDRLQEYQASENPLMVFVHGCEGTDADRIANKLPFLRKKPSSTMSSDFKKALEAKGYYVVEKRSDAKLLFPELTAQIRQQLLQIQRGDYENPYPHLDTDVRTFKALMEFIASFPLESMTQEQIELYLQELESTFQSNGGSYLKICNKILFAGAFQEAIEDEAELKGTKEELEVLLKEWDGVDQEKSITGFMLMSDIHLEEGKYPEAAGILWYAKRLDSTGKFHEKLNKKIEIVTRKLLYKATLSEGPLRSITIDHERLQKLREDIKEEYEKIQKIEGNVEKVEALRRLYQHSITPGLKAFIHELIQDTILLLKEWGLEVPCEYVILGLGSLAREEMTPHSDFEFAIVIGSEREEYKEFFRLFTNLLHLRFINLGETILPSFDIRHLNWVFDRITPRGLSFDGSMPTACKTPLGKRKNEKGDYELIHNPTFMSQLQYIDIHEQEQERLWLLQRYHLPSILSSCTYVSGSKEGPALIADYQKKVQIILERGEGKKRAIYLMRDDLARFRPQLEEEVSGKHYNVKKDLYRLVNTMFDGLANYFCLKSSSTWDRIEELLELGVFTPTAAQDLKELVMLSQELRLSTYLKHGCQKDHLDIDEQKENLQHLYFRLLPFVEVMEAFCQAMDSESSSVYLKQDRFYKDSPYYRGVIALRHMNYLEANECLDLEVVDSLAYYEVLGAVKNILGKYAEAEQAYLKVLEMRPSCDTYLKLGGVYLSFGLYLKEKHGERSAEAAFEAAQRLADESNDLLLLERVYRALTSLYKVCELNDPTRKYLKLCKEKCHERTSKKSKDPEYGVVLDLDLAKTSKIEAAILADLDSNVKEGGKMGHLAYTILKGHYRREDHPALFCFYAIPQTIDERHVSLKISKNKLQVCLEIFGEKHPTTAFLYHGVGEELRIIGKYDEALACHEKGLEIKKEIFGEKHPDTACSYNHVGSILEDLEKYEKALVFREKTLEISEEIFGEKHPTMGTSYNNLGGTLIRLGRYEEGIVCLEKGLEIKKESGEKHFGMVSSYANLGLVLCDLGQHAEALPYQEKALEISKEIFGEKFPLTATSYYYLGLTLYKLGRYEEAFVCLEKALEIRKEIFGEKHPDTALSYYDMSLVLNALERYEEALTHEEKCLEIMEGLFGEKHPNTAELHSIMSLTLYKLGRYEEALPHQEKCFEIMEGVFDEKHPNTTLKYSNMGIILCALGRYAEALTYQEKALEIQKEILGEEHPYTVHTYDCMVITLSKLGQYQNELHKTL